MITSRLTPWLTRLAVVIPILAALMILYVSFLFFSPAKPVSVSEYRITTPIVNTGTYIAYSLIFCAKKNVQFVDSRQLLALPSFTLYDLPDAIVHLDKGCSLRKLEVLIPPNIAEGQYKILDSVTIKLNSIQSAQVDFASENTFNVTKK
jgi:hypothetical protein